MIVSQKELLMYYRVVFFIGMEGRQPLPTKLVGLLVYKFVKKKNATKRRDLS